MYPLVCLHQSVHLLSSCHYADAVDTGHWGLGITVKNAADSLSAKYMVRKSTDRYLLLFPCRAVVPADCSYSVLLSSTEYVLTTGNPDWIGNETSQHPGSKQEQ